MKIVCSARKALSICTVVLLSLSFASWKEGTPKIENASLDTLPPKPEKKIVDLDKAMQDLDEAQSDLKTKMQNIDWERMNAEMQASMKDLQADMQKMQAEIKKSMQNVDVDKMRHDVETSVASIDWDKMKRDLESVKSIDMADVKSEMERVKVELQNLKPKLEKEMEAARVSMEKSKTELKEYKSFTERLEADGLIRKGEPYKIEHKDGQLLINGTVQPQEVYNKYRTFLETHKTFTLEKNADNIKLDHE